MVVWLYVNGVPTYWVNVPYPLAPIVAYEGMNFYWTGVRYERTTSPVPAYQSTVVATDAVIGAKGTFPPTGFLPDSVSQMRTYLLEGIQRMLAHPFILGLSDVDKAILNAEYRLYSTDDAAVGMVLSTLKAMHPTSSVSE